MKLFKGFTYTLSKKDPTFCPFRKNVRINTSKFSYKLLFISQASTNPTVNIHNSKTHKTCRVIELKLPTQQCAIQELKTCRASEEFSVPKLWPTQQRANSRNHKPAELVNNSVLKRLWTTQQRAIQELPLPQLRIVRLDSINVPAA